MYAIVDIAGQQYKVEKDQQIFVHQLQNEVGSSVVFDKILLIDDNGKIKIGKPFITSAGISATVLSHNKGDKVLVFHKKNRKGYEKLNGHRQCFSKIQIHDISEDKTTLKVAEIKVKAEKPVVAAKKAVAKKVVKEEVAAKAPAKKVAAKTTAKKAAPAEKKETKKVTAKAPAKKAAKTKKDE